MSVSHLSFPPSFAAPSPVSEGIGSMVSFVVTDDNGQPLIWPDGSVVTAVYSEADPGVPEGTAEYRKQRRLADNRRSAAKSRARAEHEAQCRAERINVLEEENKHLRSMLEGSGVALPPPREGRRAIGPEGRCSPLCHPPVCPGRGAGCPTPGRGGGTL